MTKVTSMQNPREITPKVFLKQKLTEKMYLLQIHFTDITAVLQEINQSLPST